MVTADPWQQVCVCSHALDHHNLGIVPSGPRDCAHPDCDCEQFTAPPPVCDCCGGDPDLVCDACGWHSCWAGNFTCENAVRAGVVKRGDFLAAALTGSPATTPDETATAPDESATTPQGGGVVTADNVSWLVQQTEDRVVHVMPEVGTDELQHDLDEDCVCGPTRELVKNHLGDGWILTHHSLDGREHGGSETGGNQASAAADGDDGGDT